MLRLVSGGTVCLQFVWNKSLTDGQIWRIAPLTLVCLPLGASGCLQWLFQSFDAANSCLLLWMRLMSEEKQPNSNHNKLKMLTCYQEWRGHWTHCWYKKNIECSFKYSIWFNNGSPSKQNSILPSVALQWGNLFRLFMYIKMFISATVDVKQYTTASQTHCAHIPRDSTPFLFFFCISLELSAPSSRLWLWIHFFRWGSLNCL